MFVQFDNNEFCNININVIIYRLFKQLLSIFSISLMTAILTQYISHFDFLKYSMLRQSYCDSNTVVTIIPHLKTINFDYFCPHQHPVDRLEVILLINFPAVTESLVRTQS